MFQLIKNYISKMTKDDLNTFVQSKNIYLSDKELEFLYQLVKNNYNVIFTNTNIDLSQYRPYFTSENYDKIIKLVDEYKIKYAHFLK